MGWPSVANIIHVHHAANVRNWLLKKSHFHKILLNPLTPLGNSTIILPRPLRVLLLPVQLAPEAAC